MIDTHAHLSPRLCDVLRPYNLDAIVMSASSEEDSKENILIAREYDNLYPAVGIHPTEVKADINAQIELLNTLLTENDNIIAVGECGLEYVGDFNPKDQEILFRGQIALAEKFNLPLIVHTREAMEETIRILSDYKNLKGVIHCYTGGKKRIQKILEMPGEWYFGIDGNLTYEVGLEAVVIKIPQDRLVLETDSPFLSPVPHRGEINNPENIKYVYEKVAQLWGKDVSETEKLIDDNARRLFKPSR